MESDPDSAENLFRIEKLTIKHQLRVADLSQFGSKINGRN
jgi:hypothetical protein